MSTNPQEQEIDLGQIGKKIGSFFTSMVDSLFDLLFFLQKKILIIALLFIIGVGLAYLLDGKKNYAHEISVIPNFGSNEFLYKRIEEINTKIRENDPEFFKKTGIVDYENLISIQIEAYPAIYGFVNNKDQENNFELIKLMAEDGTVDNIFKDKMTSINYYHHKISIVTKGMWEKEKLITPILNYLNQSQHFAEQQKIHLQNLEDKLVANDSLVKQIDKIISLLSSNNKGGSNISISENSTIPDLVDKKDKLIAESHFLKSSRVIYSDIIKEESSVLNTRDYVPLLLNTKVFLPVLLVLFYFIGYLFIRVYKKQKLRTKH